MMLLFLWQHFLHVTRQRIKLENELTTIHTCNTKINSRELIEQHIINLLSLNAFTAVTGNSSLTASCPLSCDMPSWPTTNVWRVVSTAWSSRCTYCGSGMWCNSWLSTVLYWRRVGGSRDVTSRRRDVSDSVSTWNVSVDDIVIHLMYEWSSTDTRQIQSRSAMYSWRSWRQTTMSSGSFIPVTLMTTSSALSVSVLYRRTVEDL